MSEFRAFEQKSGRYIVHLFYDEEHFKDYCWAHKPRNMVSASAVHGACDRYPVDHRFEEETYHAVSV